MEVPKDCFFSEEKLEELRASKYKIQHDGGNIFSGTHPYGEFKSLFLMSKESGPYLMMTAIQGEVTEEKIDMAERISKELEPVFGVVPYDDLNPMIPVVPGSSWMARKCQPGEN